jgi:signal peptidase II
VKPLFASSLRAQRAARRIGWSVALLVLVLDRLSKLWILRDLAMQPGDSLPLLPFLSLTFVWNEGISLGLLQQGSDGGRLALILVTGLISLLLAVWLQRTRLRLPAMALGLILGGAVGNIWDRVVYGAVADFVHVHSAGWSFYIFNVADAAISVGVVLLLLDSFVHPHDKNP